MFSFTIVVVVDVLKNIEFHCVQNKKVKKKKEKSAFYMELLKVHDLVPSNRILRETKSGGERGKYMNCVYARVCVH